jgi:hypothetical protein
LASDITLERLRERASLSFFLRPQSWMFPEYIDHEHTGKNPNPFVNHANPFFS